jgi:hypothetical protein
MLSSQKIFLTLDSRILPLRLRKVTAAVAMFKSPCGDSLICEEQFSVRKNTPLKGLSTDLDYAYVKPVRLLTDVYANLGSLY